MHLPIRGLLSLVLGLGVIGLWAGQAIAQVEPDPVPAEQLCAVEWTDPETGKTETISFICPAGKKCCICIDDFGDAYGCCQELNQPCP